MDSNANVLGVLHMMQAILTLFKTLTDFTMGEFEELTSFMVPTIMGNIRFIGESHILAGHLLKLNIKQCLLRFIPYMTT
jgi:hypothetical protein